MSGRTPTEQATPAPVEDPDLDPKVEMHIKVEAMRWALATATTGESPLLILGRAQAYASFVLEHYKLDHLRPGPAEMVASKMLH